MLYVIKPALAQDLRIRLLGIVGLAVLTAIGAQITIATQPVPVTLQVLMVLLAGLTLGARDGFASIMTYLGGIAIGLPIDANGLGAAALTGATAGYLYAFPIAAFLTGLLATRNNIGVRWLAGMVGVMMIYIIGAGYLKFYLGISWQAAWDGGVEPFIVIDMAKAFIAAACGEAARQWWQRQVNMLH